MRFIELAKKRASMRSYRETPVEREKRDMILEAGRVAPTAKNAQPVRLLVVETPEGLSRLEGAANVFHAPLVIIVCTETERAWVNPNDTRWNTVDIDASIVTDHMMLEAEDLGLNSVWICNFKPALLCERLEIPDGWKPVNILAVGYGAAAPADPNRHGEKRIALSDMVRFL